MGKEMKILDGRITAQKIYNEIKSNILAELSNKKRAPRLDMILVGEAYASSKYVKMKQKRAKEVGIESMVHHLPEDVSQKELESKIEELNLYDGVDGFMIQLPMPAHLDTNSALNMISVNKDVDGLTAENLGRLYQGREGAFAAATPAGIMLLLGEYDIEIAGKSVMIVGRSSVVGLPMSALMTNADATVTVAHSKTENLQELCHSADILISASGQAKLIGKGWVKKGAVVIDVGINMDGEGNLCGDVDFEAVKDIAEYISPVPGGVGPMTIAALLDNCYKAWAM